jgi:hypothetical protein
MRANPNDLIYPPTPVDFVPAGSQVTVTIGRNVLRKPLGGANWAAFQSDVKDRLSALLIPSAVFGPFIGRGEWEGVSEESSVLILLSQYTTDRRNIDSILAGLAETYGQDAIAWSYGPNLLATPARDLATV